MRSRSRRRAEPSSNSPARRVLCAAAPLLAAFSLAAAEPPDPRDETVRAIAHTTVAEVASPRAGKASGLAPALGVADARGAVPAGGYALARELAYGDHPRHKLDVYGPVGAKAAPVVVFFYGGRWESGERGDYVFAGEALASEGFLAVVPDYRLYPEVTFPAFIEDGAAAVRWVADNIARFGGDPDTLFLMGHSAGAYIATMLALDGRYLAAQDLEPRRLTGVIGLAGPYDFRPLESRLLRPIFESADDPRLTQPLHVAHGSAPPMLLMHGTFDGTVPLGNSLRLAERIKDAGGQADVRLYPQTGHDDLLTALSPASPPHLPVLADAAAFIRARLGERPRD